MLTFFFADKPVEDYEDARAADHKMFAKFFDFMLKNSIHLPPSGYEAWFISSAHDKTVIQRTLDVAGKAIKSLK